MQIPIDQFEQHLDETILKRGLSYYRNGHVIEVEEIHGGCFHAIVEGSESYSVKLSVVDGIMTDHSCDCPYDFGPVCKHVAALIFYLQADLIGIKGEKRKTGKVKGDSRKKTVSDQIDDLLKMLSAEEIHQFVKRHAIEDKAFRSTLFNAFPQLNEEESRAFYAKQIKEIVRKAMDRRGYVDWRGAGTVGKSVSQLLASAKKYLQEGNQRSTMFIGCAVMEQMMKALDVCDDSNGDISGCVDGAYELLFELAESGLDEAIRKQLYEFTLSSYRKGLFDGLDWHADMLDLAGILIRDAREAKQVMDLAEQVDPKISDWDYQKAQVVKLRILRQTKGEAKADAFVAENLHIPAFRHEAINNAVAHKEYSKAIRIAQEGIQKDKENKPGLALDWNQHLLNIALIRNDKAAIIENARILMLSNNRQHMPFYAILKKHVAKKDWDVFIGKLVQDLLEGGNWINVDLVAQIYVLQGEWERLVELLRKFIYHRYVGLDYVMRYEKYLIKDYAAELMDIYENGIVSLMEAASGRPQYAYACKFLAAMMKIGDSERVKMLVNDLRAKYPLRKAMLEELAKL
jgi:SWIM zinc finger